jgi:hypothetical protein
MKTNSNLGIVDGVRRNGTRSVNGRGCAAPGLASKSGGMRRTPKASPGSRRREIRASPAQREGAAHFAPFASDSKFNRSETANERTTGARDVPARSSHVSRGVLEHSNRFRQVVAAAGRDVPRSDCSGVRGQNATRFWSSVSPHVVSYNV